ncbi:MAG: hypothetical protein HRU14_18325, partial [Planctomycetes bacterium]|nr:hypothetical protein [Planctomycetota bacterium]
MDKIKENGFVIGGVGLAALLVAFLYFWTLSPVFSDMGDLTSRLKKVNGQISKFT